MMNPKDLEDYFGEDVKKWLVNTPEVKEETAPQGLALPVDTASGTPAIQTIPIFSRLGTHNNFRMFMFIFNPPTPGAWHRAGDDWTPSFKTPGRSYKYLKPKFWEDSFVLPVKTIVKVFCGTLVGTGWGAMYFEVGTGMGLLNISHPETPHMCVSGHLRIVADGEYSALGLQQLKKSGAYDPITAFC